MDYIFYYIALVEQLFGLQKQPVCSALSPADSQSQRLVDTLESERGDQPESGVSELHCGQLLRKRGQPLSSKNERTAVTLN